MTITRRDGSPAQRFDYACDACGFAAPSVTWNDETGSCRCEYCAPVADNGNPDVWGWA